MAEKRAEKFYELDHSAKFYPIISTKKAQSLFHMSAELDDEVDVSALEEAVNRAICGFPALKVRLGKRYGRYVLTDNSERVRVFALNDDILRPIDSVSTNGYMFRICCGGSRVEMDMFHGLCDGGSAIKFLRSVMQNYREVLQGEVFDAPEELPEELTEDAFVRYARPMNFSDAGVKQIAGVSPYKIEGTETDGGEKYSIGADIDIAELKTRAKEQGVSITSFICGVLAKALADIPARGRRKPLIIMVPVDLRNIFPSRSQRNFVTFARVDVKAADGMSAEDYMQHAQRLLKQRTRESVMQEFVSTTVKLQSNLVLRLIPLWLKKIIVRTGRAFMKSRQTIIFSNIGLLDDRSTDPAKKYSFNVNVSKNNPVNLGAVTYRGILRLNFTTMLKETDFPIAFFKELGRRGVIAQIS